ncbi:NAD-dependent malic enzyme, mitochondrial [Trametes pubescens]|uniref:NAD-dependent malic enzyme, mitochondrial n=1 Tax=Trametes pubescens TaxID=154538 RepID=A0A1M2VKE7_TRAPU|nr:NAD-dependent malic enzyme, mitochondrial [Trametes pubescens]
MTHIDDANLTQRVAVRGDAILTSPRWNKGTAFSIDERTAFGLTGRLPFRVNTLDEQCDRAYDQLEAREEPLRKNTFLQSLKDQNWAEAISNYSHLFRRSEGLYLTFPTQDSMEADFLEQTKGRQIDLVVCSDAEQILGIGDQGVGGIGVSAQCTRPRHPVGLILEIRSPQPKRPSIREAESAGSPARVLTCRRLLAGVNPAKALSVTLDVGTDNEELLNDHLYVGWPRKRVRGEEYNQFIDKFVQLVRKYHPHSLLHFEDFGVTNAKRLLDKYRDKHAVFNDDVYVTVLASANRR